jgi:hypothetical protein
VLEFWVQDSVDGMLLSWIRGWVHAVVIDDKSVNLFLDLLITDVGLVLLDQVLEAWVEDAVVSMFLSWVWSWVHAVVSVDESMDSLLNLLVSNVGLLLLGK